MDELEVVEELDFQEPVRGGLLPKGEEELLEGPIGTSIWVEELSENLKGFVASRVYIALPEKGGFRVWKAKGRIKPVKTETRLLLGTAPFMEGGLRKGWQRRRPVSWPIDYQHVYTIPGFKQKKDLLAAVERGELVRVTYPGLYPQVSPKRGRVFIHGIRPPTDITWFATGTMKDGKLIKVK